MRTSYLVYIICLFACGAPQNPAGPIEIYDQKILSVINPNKELITIASGLNWSEGPLWLDAEQILIFSDVPENKIYSWSKADSLRVWLQPSGHTGPEDIKREGSNGLLLDANSKLLICQHGDRRLARLESELSAPLPEFTTIADSWRGKRLNSPNDAATHHNSIYFTDPPYGLPAQDADPEKEIGFSGVFRVNEEGLVILIDDGLSRPNGIAFSPDHQFMYVANSDPAWAIWVKYYMSGHNINKQEIVYDASAETQTSPGLPDGLKVHPTGYVFATGPGGIWVFSPDNQLVAKIKIPQATSNCAFNSDYSSLFITADSLVLKLDLIAPK